MKIKTLACATACLISAAALPGCFPTPASVKTVLADPTAYLTANFSPDKLPPAVRDAVNNADSKPLGFQKMIVNYEVTVNADAKDKTSHGTITMTLRNAGGSLVKGQDDASRNGIPVNKTYSVSYRNLVRLRGQRLYMNASNAHYILEKKSFKHFDAIGRGASPLDYNYTFGFAFDSKPLDGRKVCTQGTPYPASRVFASLQGQAWDIHCTDYNNNNVVDGKYDYAYLEHYGVAIELHASDADSESELKVTDISVQ